MKKIAVFLFILFTVFIAFSCKKASYPTFPHTPTTVPSNTQIATVPTGAATAGNTQANTVTCTRTITLTYTFSCTRTFTPTATPTATVTSTCTISPTFTVTNSFTVSPTITCTFTITPTFSITNTFTITPTPYQIMLNHLVVDAEYDKTGDRIITVSNDTPVSIHVISASSLTQADLALPLPPLSVSMGQDGIHAAVGHDGWISYVNINTMTIEKTLAVTCAALDVVLAPNGYIYAFPVQDQWEYVRCINIATGAETMSGGYDIYAGTLAKMHPSGNYMYSADNGLSPNNMQKFNIQGGTAVYMYESPYWGDYSFGGNLWFSEDGNVIFARSGNIFRSTPSQTNDMTYFGHLSGITYASFVCNSQAAGSTYAVDGSAVISCYNNTFYALQKTVPIAPFYNGPAYAAQGRYVFVNSPGTRGFVLSNAVTGSGLYYNWGLSFFFPK